MAGRKTNIQKLVEIIDKRVNFFLPNVQSANTSGFVNTQGNGQTEPSLPYENVSFITRDEHRGGGHGDLPNSRPSFDLDCELVPDIDGTRRLGLSDRSWSQLYVHQVNLKGDNAWIKLDVDYVRSNLAFKTHGTKKYIYGYGNHIVKGSDGKTLYPNYTTIPIPRPLPYTEEKHYTSIKSWRVDPWYSRVDIDNQSGMGSRRSCTCEASRTNPGVEAEIVDTGNSDYLFVRFRNFFTYPVVVGVAVSY